MKKSLPMALAVLASLALAGEADAENRMRHDRSARDLNLTLTDSKIAISSDNGMAIVAQGNVVTQIMSSVYTFDGGKTVLVATEPATQGSVSAGANSGGSENQLWSSGSGSGSSYAQANASTSTAVSQSVNQSTISNGVGASTNSVSVIAVNAPTQMAVGGSYSSMSNTAVGGSVSGVSGSVGL